MRILYIRGTTILFRASHIIIIISLLYTRIISGRHRCRDRAMAALSAFHRLFAALPARSCTYCFDDETGIPGYSKI